VGRYDHLFVTDMVDAATDYVNEGEYVDETGRPPNVGRPWRLMARFDVPEATTYTGVSWIHETEDPALWVHAHVHQAEDEVLFWLGTDPDHPGDLGGAAYFELGGVRYTLTESTAVFIPRGIWHCPLGWTRVTRPFRFISMALNPTYESVNSTDLTEPIAIVPEPGVDYDHLFVRDAPVLEGRTGPGGTPAYALMDRRAVPETTVQATQSWVREDFRTPWDHPEAHHGADELLIWMGGDPADEKGLGAELTVEVGGEAHTVTTTGAVFLPRGTRHKVTGAANVTGGFSFITVLFDRYQG
jgi:quercetin dioxygenase-like cupin family protein